MRPDFVIIGAQKAGSTALMALLAGHPEVYLPDGETRYFRDPWFRFQLPDVLDRAVAPAPPGVRRRGIKCPDLLGTPEAPDRIAQVLGDDVDLLAVLRHPVDRAVSSYFWLVQHGLLPRADVEAGLRAVLDGRWASYPHAEQVVGYGRYAQHLRRYLDRFGPEHLLVLLDTDLRGRGEATLRQVGRFLDVDPARFPSAGARPVNEGVYSPVRLRWLALRHRFVVRAYPGYPGRYLQPPATRVGRLASGAVTAVDRVVLRRVVRDERPTLSAPLRARLLETYADDVGALEELLGRDLSAWRV